MQPKHVGLIVISLLVGFPSAHAVVPLPNTGPTESHNQQTSSLQLGITSNTSQSLSSNAAHLQETTAPDCDDEAPATGPVTALLSRLIRSSSIVRGKQCTGPPVPAKLEELHP